MTFYDKTWSSCRDLTQISKKCHLYRTIDIANVKTYGLSTKTAEQNGMWGLDCAENPETDREASCIDASHQLANRTLNDLAKYKQNITIAADEKCFPAALLAAFVSRQTRAGYELEGTDGWIYCHGYDEQSCRGSDTEVAKCRCFGLMHTPKGNLNLIYSNCF